MYKYVLKPPDHAAIMINEIEAHLSGRLLSCSEAVWRILGLKLHKEWPPITRLAVHLPNEQSVIFDPTSDTHDIQMIANESTSTLLQWFRLNQTDVAARQWLYTEIPEHYSLGKNKEWIPRLQRSFSIGRTMAVSFRNQELFALRRLLDVVRGACEWSDLLTVDGAIYSTFQEACGARGMLADDGDAIAAFQQIAATNCSVDSMRREFALLLLNRQCENAPAMFDMFCDDLCHQVKSGLCECCIFLMMSQGDSGPCAVAAAMHAVNDVFVEHGRSLQDIGFSLPDRPSPAGPPACFRNHVYSFDECNAQRETFVSRFTSEQHEAMADVLQAVDDTASTTRLFSVLSSAGTGKSWFVNGVTWHLRAQSRIVLNVAASALAATVLTGGRTAHSTFRIPIPASNNSLCGVKAGERQLIREAAIIFYDEISMVSVDVANTLDRSLREIMKNSKPFGGKVIVFLGDFKQLLPVMPGVKGDVTVKECEWWQLCRPIKFTVNWRAAFNPEFSEFLHQVGMGIIESVDVPPTSRVQSINELVAAVYGDDITTAPLHRNLILALTLNTCDEINSYCMEMMPGCALTATASDALPINANQDTYPLDYVASIVVHGAPPAKLTLKLHARRVSRNLSY